jgi:2-phosphosulfolactate phosphatase
VRLHTELLSLNPPRDVAVVIDVLRMTTTASHLFARGLGELFVVADIDGARAQAARSGALLLGERGGHPIPGFDGGNSPLERLEVTGRSAVLCTTNGSRAVAAVAPARHVLLGSVVNARATAVRALSLVKSGITLVCAGTLGQVSLDDVVGAGCVARELLKHEPSLRTDDATTLALSLVEGQRDLSTLLRRAEHARHLLTLGYARDVTFAARLNALDTVPERDPKNPLRFTLPER